MTDDVTPLPPDAWRGNLHRPWTTPSAPSLCSPSGHRESPNGVWGGTAFAGELTAPNPSRTPDNGLLPGTPAEDGVGRAGGLVRRDLRDSRTLPGTSPAARRRRHGGHQTGTAVTAIRGGAVTSLPGGQNKRTPQAQP